MSAVLPVKASGSPMISQTIEIGPYKTTAFGPYSAMQLAKKDVKPSIQQVSFTHDKIQFEYEMQTPSGRPVTVQVGLQQTDETTKVLGLWDSKKSGPLTGVVNRSNKDVGYFRLRNLPSDEFAFMNLKACEDQLLSEIFTATQSIRHMQRVEVDKDRSKVKVFFLGDGPLHSVYEMNGQVVAEIDAEGLWFSQNLPDDVRTCIAAELAFFTSVLNRRDTADQVPAISAGHMAVHLTGNAAKNCDRQAKAIIRRNQTTCC